MTDQRRPVVAPTANGSAADSGISDSLNELITSARALVMPGQRHFLGITGAPGSGKSTLAEVLTTSLGHDAVLVSMDGFHLANTELHRLGRHPRKGAADTFDTGGYANLLRRLHDRDEPVVYAPRFDRSLEESIGSAVPVWAETPLIITEGNYLLLNSPEWGPVQQYLDQCWYVEPGEDVRMDRLVARHVAFGRTLEEAVERSYGSDHRNAEMTQAFRDRATRIVRVPVLSASTTLMKDEL